MVSEPPRESEHGSTVPYASGEPRLPRIGHYQILAVLGEGGMGTVYLAEQKEPVRRRVALKVIKLGMDSKAVLRRFELERQALAVMNHDAIARVLEAGTTENGQPYFVMEHAPGMPLTEYCDRHKLSLAERIALFQKVCAGVQHAHQKGVIHRDLKPTNVLVTEQQGEAIPKIIDFGLARATDHMLLAQTLFTEQGVVVGTPEYMAPEQADPTESDIDTRADVYALGVMLYELLVGALPFPREELRRGGLLEMQRVIRESEPPRPSTKLTALADTGIETATRRRTTPYALRRALRDDLDWVVLKAMEKDRNRRYGSVAELGLDLARYLAHEPLLAGPPGAGYRIKKVLRRYRGQVVAGALVLLALLGGVIASTWFAVEASGQRELAQRTACRLQVKVDEFDMLALVEQLRAARARERALYPAWPEQEQGMRAWLRDDAGRLAAALPRVRETVAVLRERSPASETDRFLLGTLEQLAGDLESFLARDVPEVDADLRWAQQVGSLTVDRFRARWDEAHAAIARADGVTASELYRQRPIDLAPQMGLVPIGMNPVTKLWEFYELRSAWEPSTEPDASTVAIPVHRKDGAIPVQDRTGIVFVLIPGGAFTMGAQKDDPRGSNYDPQAQRDESPPIAESSDAFFLARHELTRGQWMRLSGGDDPGEHAHEIGRVYAGDAIPIGYTHPAQYVDWTMCHDLLERYGLTLPTEVQWEYACRAGTTTPWYTGADALSLAGHANVFDLTGEGRDPKWGRQEGDFADGFFDLAPVGSFAPNPFGLYDMHGNAYEWCLDLAPGTPDRVYRGGSHGRPASEARSANRDRFPPTSRYLDITVRAARAVR